MNLKGLGDTLTVWGRVVFGPPRVFGPLRTPPKKNKKTPSLLLT